MGRINRKRWHVLAQAQANGERSRQHRSEHAHRVFDDADRRGPLGTPVCSDPAAREHQHLADKLTATIGRTTDLGEARVEALASVGGGGPAGAFLESHDAEFGVAHDACENVVEVVSNPAGKLSKRIQLLHVPNLSRQLCLVGFRRTPLGHIGNQACNPQRDAFGIPLGHSPPAFDPAPLVITCGDPVLADEVRRTPFDVVTRRHLYRGPVFRMNQPEQANGRPWQTIGESRYEQTGAVVVCAVVREIPLPSEICNEVDERIEILRVRARRERFERNQPFRVVQPLQAHPHAALQRAEVLLRPERRCERFCAQCFVFGVTEQAREIT